MLQRVTGIVLCVLLFMECTVSVGLEDRTTIHWIREVAHTVGNKLESAVESESHSLHRYTREDEDGRSDVNTNNTEFLWNCSRLYDSSYGYNESSCRFVRENCQTKSHLINYLAFMKCDLPPKVKPVGYILLSIWCIYLISLLATTVDNFFVPPLIFLAERLKLSPSIAGITLLALGNGAPDIFCVYSGLGQGDLALVLGSLAGGAMFITSVIIATIIMIAGKGGSNVDKVDFIRDSIALVVVISAVIAVAFDGVVYLAEVLIFPLLYVCYIAVLLLIAFLRTKWKNRLARNAKVVEEQSILDEASETISQGGSEGLSHLGSKRLDQLGSEGLSHLGSKRLDQLGSEGLSQLRNGRLGSERLDQQGSRRLSQTGSEQLNQLGSEKLDQLGSERLSQLGSGRLDQLGSERLSQLGSERLNQLGSEQLNQLGSERLSQLGSGRLDQLGSERLSQLGSQRCSQPRSDRLSQLGYERLSQLRYEGLNQLGIERRSHLGIRSDRLSQLGSERVKGGSASILALEQSLALRMVSKSTELPQGSISESKPLSDAREKPRVELPGLTWPAGHHIIVKIIWAIQWPFSLLRWLTIPPFCPSGVSWSKWHYVFAVISPVPMVMLVLLAVKGWSGFVIMVGIVPLAIILIAIGIVISVFMAVLLRPSRPPHWGMLAVLVSLAFIIAIVWLNIIANEVVGVLTALGLLLNIKTAILGLTVLALGNCMADWVADTVVAKSGNTQMAFAACFGSPMLSHVLGLSVAFAVRISMDNNGAPYVFDINVPQYSVVKLAWIFLGISLVTNIIMFPIFKFKPPLFYGISLVCFYVLFAVIAVLCEIGIIPLLW